MEKPPLIFEKIETVPRRRVLKLFGVNIEVTSYAWLSLPFWVALGIPIAFVVGQRQPIAQSLQTGFIYGLLLQLITVIHVVGHILSSKIVRAPMNVALFTATGGLTLYEDAQLTISKWTHIGRALGGPALNFMTGVVALAVSNQTGNTWLSFFGIANVAASLIIISGVIPHSDGSVIWGELLGLRRAS